MLIVSERGAAQPPPSTLTKGRRAGMARSAINLSMGKRHANLNPNPPLTATPAAHPTFNV